EKGSTIHSGPIISEVICYTRPPSRVVNLNRVAGVGGEVVTEVLVAFACVVAERSVLRML
ncbi:MAG TPA: hypothetical protein VFB63_07525, partial [Bryobacteraceae bacterium]|nr:hypothetical protein [Bryobacteraceae bacterium]